MSGDIEKSGSELRSGEGSGYGEEAGSFLGATDADGCESSGGEAGPLAGIDISFFSDRGGYTTRNELTSRSKPKTWIKDGDRLIPAIKCMCCRRVFLYGEVSWSGQRCYVCCVVAGHASYCSQVRQLSRRLDKSLRDLKWKLKPAPVVPFGKSYSTEGKARAAFHAQFMQAVRCFDDGPLLELVGYTPARFKAHIESQFKRGMTWRNWGRGFGSKYGWHVDHIVAKSRYLVEELPIAYALSNLRPIWEDENMRKGNRRTHLI